jgi:hypothetical protein
MNASSLTAVWQARTVERQSRLRHNAGVRFALLVALFLRGAAFAEAADGGAEPISLQVGETRALPGMLVLQLICDDLTIVEPEGSKQGVVLKGLKPGKTTCSVLAGNYTRHVFQVTVLPKL